MKLSIVLFLLILSASHTFVGATPADTGLTPLTVFAEAFRNKQSSIQVLQEGIIIAVLADDLEGDRHQRMIVRLGNDQTLLIAHNIDLAPRVPNPSVGTLLRFFGEYEWNDQGGVVHWTHRDPDSVHVAGWLEYEGKRYGGDNTMVRRLVYSVRKTDLLTKTIDHYETGTCDAVVTLQGRLTGRDALQKVGRGGAIVYHKGSRHCYFRLICE